MSDHAKSLLDGLEPADRDVLAELICEVIVAPSNASMGRPITPVRR